MERDEPDRNREGRRAKRPGKSRVDGRREGQGGRHMKRKALKGPAAERTDGGRRKGAAKGKRRARRKIGARSEGERSARETSDRPKWTSGAAVRTQAAQSQREPTEMGDGGRKGIIHAEKARRMEP